MTRYRCFSGVRLPVDDNFFDITLCILSLNFFNDIKKVFQEIKRVLVPGAILICSVPVPERNRLQSTIRGTLYSEEELNKICQENSFSYESIPGENVALLYFRAIIQNNVMVLTQQICGDHAGDAGTNN